MSDQLKDIQGLIDFVDQLGQSAVDVAPLAAQQRQQRKEQEAKLVREKAHVAVCAGIAALLASTGQSLEQRRSAGQEQLWAAESAARDLRSAAERLEAKARDDQALMDAARVELERREAERRDQVAKLERKLRFLEAKTGVRFDGHEAAGDEKWRGRLLGRAADGAGDVPFCLDAGSDAMGDQRRRRAAQESLWGLLRPRGTCRGADGNT